MEHTRITLSHIAKLSEDATPGPWKGYGRSVEAPDSYDAPFYGEVVSTEVNCGDYCYGGSGKGVQRAEDTQLITIYRTVAPKMAHALHQVLTIHKSAPCQMCGSTYGDVTDEDCQCQYSCTTCLDAYPCATASTIIDAMQGQHEDQW